MWAKTTKKISIETEFQPVTDSSKTKQNTCANESKVLQE